MSARLTTGVVLAAEPPPGPAGLLGATLAFAWRTVMKIRHVPEQIADVILIPVILTLMFTYLFGGALAGSTSEYLQFLTSVFRVTPVYIVIVVTTITRVPGSIAAPVGS